MATKLPAASIASGTAFDMTWTFKKNKEMIDGSTSGSILKCVFGTMRTCSGQIGRVSSKPMEMSSSYTMCAGMLLLIRSQNTHLTGMAIRGESEWT